MNRNLAYSVFCLANWRYVAKMMSPTTIPVSWKRALIRRMMKNG
nr:MAG TPA: hypothetical protein [Caudoviricetes sp.]